MPGFVLFGQNNWFMVGYYDGMLMLCHMPPFVAYHGPAVFERFSIS